MVVPYWEENQVAALDLSSRKDFSVAKLET